MMNIYTQQGKTVYLDTSQNILIHNKANANLASTRQISIQQGIKGQNILFSNQAMVFF